MALLSQKQQEKNQAEREEFDGLMQAQKQRFSEFFQISCENVESFQYTETTVDDWEDLPELPAKLIIELQRFSEAVVKDITAENDIETTASLRSYTEDRFQVSHHHKLISCALVQKVDSTVEANEAEVNGQMDLVNQKLDEQKAFAE